MTDPKIHVLLIEDSLTYPQLISDLQFAESSGKLTWQQVERLDSATEILRTKPVDIVLLDLFLPDSNGLDTFTNLYPHAICLPIIVLTNPKNEPLALQTLPAGAQDYFIQGQMDVELLLRALRHSIERKQTEISLRLKIHELAVAAQQLESAGRIGYQLNNSLAVISLSVEMLLARIPPEDRNHMDLQTVYEELRRMGRLVTDLLQVNDQNSSQILTADRSAELNNDTADLIQHLQDQKIVIVRDEETYFFETGEAGTAGYIFKGASINELVSLIQHLIQAGVRISPASGTRWLNRSLEEIRGDRISSNEQLSLREREVLRLIAKGRTNKEIAKRLSISTRTVERHRSSIMNKFGFENRAELVAYAIRQSRFGRDDTK